MLSRFLWLLLSLLISVRADRPSILYPFLNGVSFGTPEAGAQVLKELGYEGVGSVYGRELEGVLDAYEAAGLSVFSIYVGGRIGVEAQAMNPGMVEAIARLKGRDTLVELFVQGDQSATDEQAVAFVRKVAVEAEKSGLRVVLYPHAGFHIDTVGDAFRIAKQSGCDNVGVAFNLCHFLKVEPESDLKQTLEKVRPLLWSVSICGADVDGRNWAELIRPLDEGSFDQAGLLDCLRELGYQGPFGLQCYGIKLDPRENLERSLKAWRMNGGGTSPASRAPSP